MINKQKKEYFIDTDAPDTDSQEGAIRLQDRINNYAKEGWELFMINNFNWYIYERQAKK